MPALPPIKTTVCPSSSGFRGVETGVAALVICPSHSDRLAICASIGATGRGMSAICMRSVFTAVS